MQRRLLALCQFATSLLLYGMNDPLSDFWILGGFLAGVVHVDAGGRGSFLALFFLFGNGRGFQERC